MKTNEISSADLLSIWAQLKVPARIDVETTARLLGVAEHDVPILIATKLLKPLGKPAPNAPKKFAAIEIISLAADRQWLDTATRRLSEYWKTKRIRQEFYAQQEAD